MGYLLTQLLLYMLAAFLLGLLLGWIVWGRLRVRIANQQQDLVRLESESRQLKSSLEDCRTARQELEKRFQVTTATTRPPVPDNLRRILGIGPVNEKLLNEAGISTFAQIAAWTAHDISRIEGILQFDGRIERERWIAQASLLAEGDEEEFLRRFPSAATQNNS